MNKTFIIFTLVSALFVSAVTTVLSQTHLISPIILFPVLSLIVPILLRRADQFRDTLAVSMKYHVHSWAIANVFIFFTTILTFTIDNALLALILFFIAYFLVQLLIELIALLMTMFFGRQRRFGIIDEAIDMCMYILPVPFIYIGSILYIDIYSMSFLSIYARAIDTNLLFAELLLLVITLFVFVMYMYPRAGIHKFPRLVRIIITAVMWLAMNAHILYGGYVPEFVKALMPIVLPIYQGNVLVFFTPGLIEASFIIAAVFIGRIVELGVVKAMLKRS